MQLEDLSYINTLDMLTATGMKNISSSGGEISFSCPGDAHQFGDHSPSARMNSRTTAFICHGCGQRGNAISFLAWAKHLPETVARRLLEERYGGGRLSVEAGGLEDEVYRIMNPVKETVEERTPPSTEWLDSFRDSWTSDAFKYWYDRGFSSQAIKDWEIGFDLISQRIVIPIFDHDSNLIGFKGRAINDGPWPKYMILGDRPGETKYGFQPYQKSKHVFGLNRLKQQIKIWEESGPPSSMTTNIIIVEGELNVIRMIEYDFDNTVGIAGSEFSEAQRDLIVRHSEQAIIYLDNDKSGHKGTSQVVEMLMPYMPVKVVQDAPGDACEIDEDTANKLILNAKPALQLLASGVL